LTDGTVIWLSGRSQTAGDTIAIRESVAGQSLEADAVGMLAVRLHANGRLEALAAGGLSRFQCGGVRLLLDPPLDLAIWTDASGRRRGVVQGTTGEVPRQLRELASQWSILTVPKRLPSH
jgi:hypothetical protein